MAQEVFLLSILNEYRRISVYRVGGAAGLNKDWRNTYTRCIYTPARQALLSCQPGCSGSVHPLKAISKTQVIIA